MSQLQAQKLRLAYTRSSHYGGSLPNVNQIGCGLAEFQVSGRWLAGCQGWRAGSQGASSVDLPVSFGRAPSTPLWIHLGALDITGWWNGCSEIPEEWCPHFTATPATLTALPIVLFISFPGVQLVEDNALGQFPCREGAVVSTTICP